MGKNSLYIVIVGCGRLGSHLGSRLSAAGHSVVIVDKSRTTFGNLSPEFSGFQVEGDATQIAVLREAKIDKADLVIASTHEDNVNLMVTQVAGKIFGVPHVLARLFDPGREEVYAHHGIETVCPTTVAADLFLNMVDRSADRRRTKKA